ncbi:MULTISPECIES: N-acetylglucosamine-6-phosphate deacetylase [unclassified Haematospirillum]|uniref:N-acetylglucosamine-6-phosphate deacetylase n=1 Tax=unclassified Haematospirillum TaxID=2622088 RepID=UPI00143B9F14|nr:MULTISPECIES: N-acetylglucosamine-6-phosphate deacetylase [unclassified Haematospirillum]NKD55543.1 N-acetylglucosamine-6-phosphate deacetylase [Haematospirillum sp. H4890]NKD75682.1 N-acetylglucosamine-6-phosphate deacetylase [Haematospirillum sp. H4485]
MFPDQTTFLAGPAIFTGMEVLVGHGILIQNGIVSDVLPSDKAPRGTYRINLPDDSFLVPGFFDAQVNGAGGLLFNDAPNEKTARHMDRILRTFGVTGFLPTLITDNPEKMRQAADTILHLVDDKESSISGLHLEGPFINPIKRGCHNDDFVRCPEEEDIRFLERLGLALQEKGTRLLLTAAPETMPEVFARHLVRSGVVLSMGHSEATYEQALTALRHGFSGFTHLGNAMSPVRGQDPGLLGAALLSAPGTWGGLIADGIHVHPALVRLFLREAQNKGCKPFLVSDSMPLLGTGDSVFSLYGTPVFRRNGRLETENGTLAGADISILHGLKWVLSMTDIKREEAWRMASLYPCQFLGLDQSMGHIRKGMRANLTLLSQDMDILATWVNGVSTSL